MAQDRLQKILAHAGAASRRAAEELILAGRVTVNGRVVSELGAKADLEHDRIELDGRRLSAETQVYYLLHKPRSMVTTLSDPEGRPTIAELLEDVPERVYPIGRLDFHTSGALLVTNDGALADALLHPKRGVKKTYVAKLDQVADEKQIAALRNGVVLDDGYRTQPASVVVLRDEDGHGWLEITIGEGKNRQIHRMAEAVGLRVMRLVRTRFAGIDTEGLRPGQIRPLSNEEVDQLKFTYLGVAPSEPRARERSKCARKGERGERVRVSERSDSTRPNERTERTRNERVRGPEPAKRERESVRGEREARSESRERRDDRVRPRQRGERATEPRVRSNERREHPSTREPRDGRGSERVRPHGRDDGSRNARTAEGAEVERDRTEARGERSRAERVRPRAEDRSVQTSVTQPRARTQNKGLAQDSVEPRRSTAQKRTTRDEKQKNRR